MQEFCSKENQLMYRVRRQSHVLIYGAGMVGELVLRYLSMQGLKERVLGFAISKVERNAERASLLECPIYGIQEWKARKEETLVIVATLPNLHEEMGRKLTELEFSHVLFITERLYKELCRRLICDYKNKYYPTFPADIRTRILFMASDNSRVSGAFLCMTELCEQLQKHGIGVLAILPCYGTGTSLLEEKGVPYTYIESRDWVYKVEDTRTLWKKLPFLLGLLSNGRAKRELIRLLREQQVDLVHCNTTYTYIGAVAAKHCGIPFVWHLRENLEHQGCRIFRQKKAWKLMQQAGRIITVSRYIRELFPFAKKGLMDVVYDAVDTEGTVCREREILRGKTVQMIQVGVLTEYKGQEELLSACRILKSSDALDFHLLLVGKGLPDYVEKLHRLVKEYGLEENVTFYGAAKEVYRLYAQSDLSFMCSSREAYGRVTIESQLSGCLVIGVNSGATPELIEDQKTGYLYQAGDVQALAEKIMEAVTDGDKSRVIARNGQNYARKMYTNEKSVGQILRIYEEVLGRRL